MNFCHKFQLKRRFVLFEEELDRQINIHVRIMSYSEEKYRSRLIVGFKNFSKKMKKIIKLSPSAHEVH